MRHIIPAIFLISLSIIIASCKKDLVENKVPVVNAGNSQNVTLPFKDLTLSGEASDKDGNIVAYLWSQVSGPEVTTITDPGSQSTKIKGFIAGTYIFQLMATDNKGATGVDSVSIIVNPAPEQTLTLQPTNNPNEKMLIMNGVDVSEIGSEELIIDAWTKNGYPWYGRAALNFDMSSIPNNATILSAHLFLYSNVPPINGNHVDANSGSNNALILQQITSNWSPSTLNWTNQPVVATSNQIIIPSTTQSALDLNIDVTGMVSNMISTNQRFGFFLQLQNEIAFTSRMFVSSYHKTKIDKHPKLVIVFKP